MTDNRTITEIALKCMPTVREAMEDEASRRAAKLMDQMADEMIAKMPADLRANLANIALMTKFDENGNVMMMQGPFWVVTCAEGRTVKFEGGRGWSDVSDEGKKTDDDV